jgi:hypothetical protein
MSRDPSATILLVALAAVCLAAPAAASMQAFNGNVCHLLSAKQIATVVGDSATGKYACVNQKTVKTAASTSYTAHAGPSAVASGGFFSIQIVKYTSAKVEALVQAQFKKSLKPLPGIGDWAYSRIAFSPVVGGTADIGELVFGTKGYSVLLTVRAKLGKTINQPALKGLAKQIAGQL